MNISIHPFSSLDSDSALTQHFCFLLTQMSACTDLACLSDLQWPCSAPCLLLEKVVHCVLQLLIVLEQTAELPANVHCATGEN